MKVKRNTLLLIACLVWGAAGFNILRLGVLAYPAYLSVLNFVLSALVFAVFQYFIFGRLVKKHTARITGYEEERHFFLKFFDVKSFIIMAVMMGGGIWLRSSGLAPDRFIAVFYTGLGASLLTAGIRFGYQFVKAVIAAGERETGITIHYIDEHYDEGTVIFQAKCPVLPSDTPEEVAAKVHALEYAHYPKVIEDLLAARI